MRLHRLEKTERGAVLPLAAAGIILAMIASALAVDLGFLADTARASQKIADLAALDAARVLPANPTAAAVQSAARNGLVASIPSNFNVECGATGAGPFNAAACTSGAAGAVRVSASKPHRNLIPFVGSGRQVTRSAVGQVRNLAGFSLGSALARVDSSVQAPMFNRVFERFLGSSTNSLALTAVGYQGLAAGYITLGGLQSQLGFATVNELLSANLTVKQILQATSIVMNNQGVAGWADIDTIVGSIGPTSVANTTNIKLGDLITVASGAEGAAASTGLNVLQLVSGSAELANKDSFISVPNAIANVPVAGIGNVGTTIGLKVVEPPQIYIGQQGGSVTTSQVEVTFTPTVDVAITLPAPVGSLLRAVGTLTVVTGGAGATGTLTTVRCTSPQGVVVTVDTTAATTQVSTQSPPGTLNLRTALNLVAGTVNVAGSAVGAPNTSVFDFDFPGEFSPTAPSLQTPSAALNMTVTSTSSGTVSISIPPLISVTLPAGVVSGAVLTAVKPLLDRIATQVGSREFAALGLSVGLADVGALRDAFSPSGCGQPALFS